MQRHDLLRSVVTRDHATTTHTNARGRTNRALAHLQATTHSNANAQETSANAHATATKLKIGAPDSNQLIVDEPMGH